MKYDAEIHHRRSIRLEGYDYSRDGAYFVTICAQDRRCVFGDVVERGKVPATEVSKVSDGEGGWKHAEIRLEPDNADFKPIVLTPKYVP